jgi:hypothetical protein
VNIVGKRIAIVAVCSLIAGAAGAALWFWHFRPASVIQQPRPVRSVAELEELVYLTPFDPDLELELARASWQRFQDSMKTDERAASECMTSYMIATIESNSRKEIVEEFRPRFQQLASLAGAPPETNLERFMETFRALYDDGVKKNILHVLSVREAIEPVFARIHADDRGDEDVVAAEQATERYLRHVFDVEIGRVHVETEGGDSMYFTPAFFKAWEDGLRSYGLICAAHSRLSVEGFLVYGPLNAPPDAGMKQIISGDSYGRFSLPENRELIPGLRYFNDAASREASEGYKPPQGEPADGPDANTPVGTYRRFIDISRRGLWSQAFDLVDPAVQHQLGDAMRETLQSQITDASQQDRLKSITDRELWITAGTTGEMHPTAIVAVETQGDQALVHTRSWKAGSVAEQAVPMVRVNGGWKIGGGSALGGN